MSCLNCKHFNVESWGTCKAFPLGIPLDINDGTFLHKEIHPSQKNKVVYKQGVEASKRVLLKVKPK